MTVFSGLGLQASCSLRLPWGSPPFRCSAGPGAAFAVRGVGALGDGPALRPRHPGGLDSLAGEGPCEARSSRTVPAPGGSRRSLLRFLGRLAASRLRKRAFLVVLVALRSVLPRQQPSRGPRRRCRGAAPRCREASGLCPPVIPLDSLPFSHLPVSLGSRFGWSGTRGHRLRGSVGASPDRDPFRAPGLATARPSPPLAGERWLLRPLPGSSRWSVWLQGLAPLVESVAPNRRCRRSETPCFLGLPCFPSFPSPGAAREAFASVRLGGPPATSRWGRRQRTVRSVALPGRFSVGRRSARLPCPYSLHAPCQGLAHAISRACVIGPGKALPTPSSGLSGFTRSLGHYPRMGSALPDGIRRAEGFPTGRARDAEGREAGPSAARTVPRSSPTAKPGRPR